MKKFVSFRQALRLVLLLALVAIPFLAAFQAQPAQAATACLANYTVKEGESIYGIAARYGINASRIAAANSLKYPYKLTQGQVLCIPNLTSFTNTAKLVPEIYGKNLYVYGVGFSAKTTVVVKARIGDAGKWYKLGILNIKDKNSFSETYVLPSSLQGKLYIQVCFKDMRTSALLCRQATYYK